MFNIHGKTYPQTAELLKVGKLILYVNIKRTQIHLVLFLKKQVYTL